MTNLENLEFTSRYPTEGVMRDGTSIIFAPLKPEDREKLEGLIDALPPEDLLYLRQDITNDSVIDTWMTSVESGQVFTVLASVGARVVGYASLHIDSAIWSRHVGEIRINVHPDYRGTGLGAALAGEIRFVDAQCIGNDAKFVEVDDFLSMSLLQDRLNQLGEKTSLRID